MEEEEDDDDDEDDDCLDSNRDDLQSCKSFSLSEETLLPLLLLGRDEPMKEVLAVCEYSPGVL